MAEQSGEQQAMQLEPQEPAAVAAAAGPPTPSVTTAARALDLNTRDLVDQIFDSLATLCVDGFAAVNQSFRDLQVCVGSEDGPHQSLSPEVLTLLWQGMAALADEHQARIDEQVAKFEAHVMQTSLHVPAGLLASAPPAPAPGSQGEGEMDEGRVAEQAAVLARLRDEIAEANQAARRVQQQIKKYDEALAKYGDLSALQAVAGALAGKENAAEDAAAMVAKGADLLGDCEGLERLGRDRSDRGRAPPKDALAAEKALLQLHPAAAGITPQDLRAFQELLSQQ